MRHPAPTSWCERAAPDPQVVASDPGSSVWVAANAGTGKTWVLVDRITRLLVDGIRPDRILCLTFTKAAAAEMANRLGDRLGAWSVMEEGALTAELTALLGRRPLPPVAAAARRLLADPRDPGQRGLRDGVRPARPPVTTTASARTQPSRFAPGCSTPAAWG